MVLHQDSPRQPAEDVQHGLLSLRSEHRGGEELSLRAESPSLHLQAESVLPLLPSGPLHLHRVLSRSLLSDLSDYLLQHLYATHSHDAHGQYHDQDHQHDQFQSPVEISRNGLVSKRNLPLQSLLVSDLSRAIIPRPEKVSNGHAGLLPRKLSEEKTGFDIGSEHSATLVSLLRLPSRISRLWIRDYQLLHVHRLSRVQTAFHPSIADQDRFEIHRTDSDSIRTEAHPRLLPDQVFLLQNYQVKTRRQATQSHGEEATLGHVCRTAR